MARYLTTLRTEQGRADALRIVSTAPLPFRLEVKAVKRSLPQNKRFWAMLTDIARQVPWAGEKRTPDDWKKLFIALWRKETRLVPGLDGGIVDLGYSSSDLSKEEMAELIDCMAAWGAENGVKFQDEAA